MELIGSRTVLDCRGPSGVGEVSAWSPAAFYLPVVHVLVREIEPEPECMRSFHPRRIRVVTTLIVVPPLRPRGSGIAIGRVTRDPELRHAAVGNVVRIVR